MRCLHCQDARAMPAARPGGDPRTGSMFRLCQDCAYVLAPTTTTAWLKLQHYRYPQHKLSPAELEAAHLAAWEEELSGRVSP